jgi:moderate conductance mechanosensitive channel
VNVLAAQSVTDEIEIDTVAWWLDHPFRIFCIIVGAMILSRLVRRAIKRVGQRLRAASSSSTMGHIRERTPDAFRRDDESRAIARSETITAVLSSSASAMIWVIATLLVLGELGISLGPLLAGAGVAGVALGFGAQTIVADFLAGFFMLVEDQYGVGDVIDVGEVSGTVERVSLRTTVLRDVHGTVWHVPNSQIRRVANKSQLWSRAVLDIAVSHETDVDLAQGIIQRVADELWQDGSFLSGVIIEPPEVWGVEQVTADTVLLRLVVKTDPAEQWVVARELRLRIKRAFDAAGIDMSPAPRTVRNAEPVPPRDVDRATIPVAPIRRGLSSDELVENP